MPKLNDNQLKQLADFTSNLGLVFFATAVTPVFSTIDNVNPFVITLGLGLTITCIIVSVLILKRGFSNDKS